MSRKQSYRLIAAAVCWTAATALTFAFAESLTQYLSAFLSSAFDRHESVLAFKDRAGELLIVGRKWVGTPFQGQWVNSLHSFDFVTHIGLPLLLVTFLTYLIHQLRKGRAAALSFLAFNLFVIALRIVLPVKNAFATEYTLIDGAAKKAYSGFFLENISMPLQNVLESYGAIGLRLYLPLILFTVLIYPYLKQGSSSVRNSPPRHAAVKEN